MQTSKLKTRDVITVVLLSLVNIIIFSLGSFLYISPVTILMMPVFYALLQGIVFFVIGEKVPKKGAMLIYCVIQGAAGFYIPYILMFVLAGLICEAILRKNRCENEKGLTVSYVIMQVLACLGSTVYPYTIALDATMKNMHNAGDLSVYVEKAAGMIRSWGALVLVLAVAAASFVGAFFGKKVVARHMAKARTVELEEAA